jgi:hypothetical protein
MDHVLDDDHNSLNSEPSIVYTLYKDEELDNYNYVHHLSYCW